MKHLTFLQFLICFEPLASTSHNFNSFMSSLDSLQSQNTLNSTVFKDEFHSIPLFEETVEKPEDSSINEIGIDSEFQTQKSRENVYFESFDFSSITDPSLFSLDIQEPQYCLEESKSQKDISQGYDVDTSMLFGQTSKSSQDEVCSISNLSTYEVKQKNKIENSKEKQKSTNIQPKEIISLKNHAIFSDLTEFFSKLIYFREEFHEFINYYFNYNQKTSFSFSLSELLKDTPEYDPNLFCSSEKPFIKKNMMLLIHITINLAKRIDNFVITCKKYYAFSRKISFHGKL